MKSCCCSLVGSKACETCGNGPMYAPFSQYFPWPDEPNTTGVPLMTEPVRKITKIVRTYEYDAEGRIVKETTEEF